MAQTKESLEEFYLASDPWGVEESSDDKIRKQFILAALKRYPEKFFKALDIGCGEGFITKDLPANRKYGIEISDNAASRLPLGVHRIEKPKGQYDLVVATGVLYKQYDWEQFHLWIKTHACKVVLTCSIKDWEVNNLPEDKIVYMTTFPYRDYQQILRVYEV